MAGYAYPVGATTADTGTAKSVTDKISQANTLVELFSATSKTRVNYILASNSLGTILPVELHVFRTATSQNHFVSKARVLKGKYLVMPLVSGDTRIDKVDVDTVGNDIKTELVLQVGDKLKFKCPLADYVNITIDMKEGIK